MKKLLAVSFLAFATILNSFSAPSNQPPTSAEQLRSEFGAAVKAKDMNAILSLFYWKGISAEMKTKTSRQIAVEIKPQETWLSFEPLPADFPLTNELDGVRSFPNVHVVGLINLSSMQPMDDLMGLQLTYGEIDGKFYIAGTVEEVFDPHAKKSISIGMMVAEHFTKENPGTLTCLCVYVAGGKEKTVSFQHTNESVNNWRWGGLGDYIKSCKVTKISGSGSFQLTINENYTNVFDSGLVETNGSISYEKKD